MVLKTLFSSLALFLFSCGNSAVTEIENTPNKPSHPGQELYTEHCAQCHGEDGKLGASGAKDLSSSKLNEGQTRQLILKGKNGMPPMEYFLDTDEKVQKVIDYISTFRKQ
jgi:cytochrome c6